MYSDAKAVLVTKLTELGYVQAPIRVRSIDELPAADVNDKFIITAGPTTQGLRPGTLRTIVTIQICKDENSEELASTTDVEAVIADEAATVVDTLAKYLNSNADEKAIWDDVTSNVEPETSGDFDYSVITMEIPIIYTTE